MHARSCAEGGALSHDLSQGGWKAARQLFLFFFFPFYDYLQLVFTAPGLGIKHVSSYLGTLSYFILSITLISFMLWMRKMETKKK